MEKPAIAYPLGDSLYLNVTNRCTNDCLFCIRRTREGLGCYDLWLPYEPELKEVLKEAGDIGRFREVVFCGYGEPLVRADLVLEVARELKNQGALIRVNTNGQANLIHDKNVASAMHGLVDTVSISLNTSDPFQYVQICQPLYGVQAYQGLLEFVDECKKHVPNVILSAVTWPGVDMDRCREVARQNGVGFRIRRLTGTFTS